VKRKGAKYYTSRLIDDDTFVQNISRLFWPSVHNRVASIMLGSHSNEIAGEKQKEFKTKSRRRTDLRSTGFQSFNTHTFPLLVRKTRGLPIHVRAQQREPLAAMMYKNRGSTRSKT